MVRRTPTLAFSLILGGDAFKPQGIGPSLLTDCLQSLRSAKAEQIVIVDTGIGAEAELVIAQESAQRQTEHLAPIEVYPFQWIDDFAAARNEALRYIKTTYMAWVDGDDVILGGENLRPLVEEMAGNSLVLGSWHPYQYAFDEYGNVSTLHRRERVVRMDAGWIWRHRVHEVLEPQRKGLWVKRDSIIWKHQRPAIAQTDRNLRLLYMEYAENPEDLRTIYNIGHQYFTSKDWPKAIEWLERFAGDDRALLVERWQALCYTARALRQMEELNKALTVAFMAVALYPSLADGYLQVAEVYHAMEEWERAIHWALLARQHWGAEVPEPAFSCPIEDEAQVSCILNRCYAITGNYAEALKEAELALKFMPKHEGLLLNQALFKESLGKIKTLEGFQALAGPLSDRKKLALAKNLNGLSDEGMARDITIPAIMRLQRKGSKPRIIFYCGNTLDEWSSETPSTIGIGGAETAVVEIAKRFAQAGWSSVVYNKCGVKEGLQDGVLYADFRRWPIREQADIFVSWRQVGDQWKDVDAREKWLWIHDLNKRDGYNQENCAPYDRILGVSQFHADYLAQVYPFMAGRLNYVNNGINLERFQGIQERVPHRAIWTSSPDRGLIHLLELWPIVRSQVDDAELHIFYGWENIDKVIAGGASDLAAYKILIEERIKQPGVEWRGRVSQAELAREFMAAQIWPYPTSMAETFCISAAEAMAGGALVATSDHGNLPNVVGDAGLLLRGHPANQLYRRAMAGYIITMMQKPDEECRNLGYQQAQRWTWDASFEKWLSLVSSKPTLVRELAHV